MKEIGGYFELEHFTGEEYYGHLLHFNIARNALRYIIKKRSIKKIYLPYLLTDSVANLCKSEHCDVEFYNIDNEFHVILTKELGKNDYLYVVNHYGFLSKQYIYEVKKRYNRIVLDNVQAFFQEPITGLDTIYCCRKYFGVPDGAYLSTDFGNILNLPESKVIKHMEHLLGRFEECASDYYFSFSNNERLLEDSGYCSMSRISRNILCGIDYCHVKSKRESNYMYLHKRLAKINSLNFEMPIGPYAYPLYIPNGFECKKELAQKKIYIPTLWPSVLHCRQELEIDYSKNILPLPCDQRYEIEDMKILCDEVERCIN